MKTLENLFFGNEIPFELPPLDREEYHRLIEELDEIEDPLLEQLTKEQQQLYAGCCKMKRNISPQNNRKNRSLFQRTVFVYRNKVG